MAEVKGVNVTKYDAGGSGDNYIPDGYIKTVEHIWMDSYEASALASSSSINIAKLEGNKKITSVEIYHDALGAGVTCSVGDSDSTARYIPAASLLATAGVVRMSLVDGFQYVTGTADGDTTVQIITTGGGANGTIKSIVRYT